MTYDPAEARRKNTTLAVTLFGVVAGMVGVAFAAVPLYTLFCQVTGYGGTPKVATGQHPARNPDGLSMDVRFDANVARDLPWVFRPVQQKVTVSLGEETLAHYTARNTGRTPLVGTATFNVTPFKAAQYFTKIECFCFTEQRLEPGQEISMPVVFYIDPAIASDPNARDVGTVTLSYTFFRDDKAAAAAPPASPPGRGS